LSTAVLYPNDVATWKQEVNQRLDAHRRRRSLLTAQSTEPALKWAVSSGRGSQVAARVAARYAQAPSYSELQAVEAPVAQPAAPPAPKSAPKPIVAVQAAEPPRPSAPLVQAVLPVARPWEPDVQPLLVSAPLAKLTPAPALSSAPLPPPESLDAWESEYAQNAWQPDPGLRPAITDVVRSPRPQRMDEFFSEQGPVAVEPDQPIHANLIEFPREVVATRKMRPRRAERTAPDRMDRQLSIFEVDPGTFPAPAQAEAAPAPATWTQPEWSGIKLQAQTQQELRREEPSNAEADVHLAPVGHRLMAVLVDGALVTAVFVVLTFLAAAGAGAVPAPKAAAFGAAAILLILGLLYQALFLLLAEATPGMRYAGISLCTFDGQIPTAPELRSRLGALLLSVAPICLGLAWALFDEDHLCWHDRLSRTYLRKE